MPIWQCRSCMGLTCPIANPEKIAGLVRAADLVLGRDDYAIRFIEHYQINLAILNRFTYTFRELLPGVEALERTMGYLPGTAPEPVTELIMEVSEELVPMGRYKG
ncbi:MAG: hypothetical protein MZV63_52400 [Marinilabiliales bacterium]|nr:hypothetical protein [Marinilabiliales bacterium]